MCGRYFLSKSRHDLVEFFAIPPGGDRIGEEDLQASYNVQPTQQVPAASMDRDGQMRLDRYRWGLIPPSVGGPRGVRATMFNARRETIADRPAYRNGLRSRRALVPADGFYEWDKTTRQPYAFVRVNGATMVFAGVWEVYRGPDGSRVRSVAIVTAPSNADMPVHDRIPVILERDAWARWVDPSLGDRDELSAMLTSGVSGRLRSYPVDRRVGSVRNDDPALIEPITVHEQQTLLC